MTQSGLSRQKTKLKMIFSFLVLTVLIASIGISIVPSINVNGQNSSTGVTNHDPIQIHGNDDFTTENGVTGGSGTKNDPYIIENWYINASASQEYKSYGIKIESTTVYFIIKNCEIHHGDYGIYLSSTCGKIENCKIYNEYTGVFISGDNNQIISSNIYNNTDGITTNGNNEISRCNIYNNEDGIAVNGGNNDEISRCNIYNNEDGISIGWGAMYTEIHYNNIYNNTNYGVNRGGYAFDINATNNWWGSADGPRGAGSGSGDAVTDGVSYDPWLKSYYEGAGVGGGDNKAFAGLWLYIFIPVIIVVVIVGILIGVKKIGIFPKRQTQQKQQWAQQGPQQPTQPMPSQQHVCPLCGQPLRYISEYQRWWCDNCKRYA